MTFPARRPLVRRGARVSAVVLLSCLALVACSDDDPVPTSGDTTQQPGKKASRTPKPQQADRTPTESADAGTDDDGTAVPIYWVGDGPGGEPRLFREFHRVQGNPLTEAARLVMGGGQPDDPDYRTLWPEVEVADVSDTDGVLLVQVPGDGFTERPDGMSQRDAELAMQQLVYTLQGVQQERVPIMVQRDGADLPLLGMPTDRQLEQASALETLNLVSITSPAEGATISAGDSMRVSGVANSFEANVLCELLVGEEVVGSGPITAEGWGEDRLFAFDGELGKQEAPPGKATLRCSTDDPSGGAEGNGPAVDTRNVVLQ